MDGVALGIALILFSVAGVHFLWASGFSWPADNDAALARMTIGAKGISAMPPRWVTAMVATGIACAGIIPLMWRGLVPYPHLLPQTLLWLGMWVLVGIFLLRGVGGLFAGFAELEQPFKRLNQWIFFTPDYADWFGLSAFGNATLVTSYLLFAKS